MANNMSEQAIIQRFISVVGARYTLVDEGKKITVL
jgi:hypothetical protein